MHGTRVDTGGRAPAWTGLAHVVLVFAGSAAIGGTSGAGRHSLDASASEIATYLADADRTRVWIGEYVAVLGYLLFLVFAPFAWAAVNRAGRPHAADRAGNGLATCFVALSLAGTACLAPALNRSGEGAAPFLDLRTTLFLIAFLAFGGWLLALGLHAIRGDALPRWLGWAAVVVGALHLGMAPLATVDLAFTGIPTFAGFLWIAIASVLLARRGERAPAAA